jgi:hypothetical protein
MEEQEAVPPRVAAAAGDRSARPGRPAVLAGAGVLALGLVAVAPALLVIAMVAVVLAVVVRRRVMLAHWSGKLLLGALLVALPSTAFVWWVLGARIDAADAGTPEPDLASWGGPALLLAAVSGLTALVAVGVALVRAGQFGEPRSRPGSSAD